MSFEGMFPLPDYDGGPADRLRDMARGREPQPGDGPDYHAEHAAWRGRAERISTNQKQDWVETEHLVRIEQDLIGQYSNEITLDDLIKAGIIALRAQNRIKFVESECTDGGF